MAVSTQLEPVAEYDIIVVGAGVVGCAAARAFGNDGRKVLLVERDMNEPDRIVGELLQPGGVNALRKLGMEDCVEGIDGIPCYGYGVIRNKQLVHIPYPVDKETQEKSVGKSFHHGRFINNLRKSAKGTKNVTVLEATVTTLLKDEEEETVVGVVAMSSDRTEIKAYAPLTIVADGLFSKFRKEITELTPDVRSNFVGFVLKDLVLPFPQHGHVILADPSPILLYQISTHDTRILVDVPGKLPSVSNGDLKRYLQKVVAPELPEDIKVKFLESLETERLRSMPNGWLPPSHNKCAGMIVLGDAMNVRHPLTGGGMTVGLSDVVSLVDLLSVENVPSLTQWELVASGLQTFYWRRKNYCVAINVLAMALYALFSAGDNEELEILQHGCFGYFQLGGECVNGPVGLLSGLIQRPMVLVYHFFSVAFYSIYLNFKKGSWADVPRNIWKSVTVLYTACVVILPYLLREAR
ncbi:squalene epoxidase-domain-containing protein [Umbelopsis sp. PMI_123]|nr:squalene epoxidase-domain-containing protein [Umbelopsis sp. PMI_123]